MVFENEAQLKSFLLKKCRLALMRAQDEVYKIIKNFLRQYYTSYDPVLYDRTYQLLQSLVQSRVVSKGDGYEAEIYFNIGALNYTTGAHPSGEQVMEAAASGGHGAAGLRVVSGDIGIWDDPVRVLDAKAIDILKGMLMAEGIPIE